MSIRYNIAYQQLVPTYVCQEASVRRAEKVCQSVPGRVVDQAISVLLLDLMQPMTLQFALQFSRRLRRGFPRPIPCDGNTLSGHSTRRNSLGAVS